jgi:hypothetical protein
MGRHLPYVSVSPALLNICGELILSQESEDSLGPCRYADQNNPIEPFGLSYLRASTAHINQGCVFKY